MHHSVIWTSEDGQGILNLSGDYIDVDGNRVSVATVKRLAAEELLGQCSSAVEHDNILAGTIVVDNSEPMACR